MARRYYGLNRGQTETGITESSSTTSKNIEMSFDLAVGFAPADVFAKLDEFKKLFLASDFPPATTAQDEFMMGMNFGQTETDARSDVANFAVLVNQAITYTARQAGIAGNDITLALIDPPGNNVALSVLVTDTDIVVTLATDGSSAITTTRAQLAVLLQASAPVQALISVSDPSAGPTTAITAVAETPLATGAAPTLSNDDIYILLDMTAGLQRQDVLNALAYFQQYLIGDNFPPA